MKRLLLLLLLLGMAMFCLTNMAKGQDNVKVDNAVNRVRQFYNAKQTDSLFGLLSPRIQQLMPLDKTMAMMDQLHQKLGDLNSCTFSKQDGGISYYNSVFTNAELLMLVALDAEGRLSTFRIVPKPAEKSEQGKGEMPVTATSGGVLLHGTLTMPDDVTRKVPVVLLIAGSGPTDRNGNSNQGLTSNAYRMLADSLREAGIACVRYDKRGIGESMAGIKSEADMRFDDMVADAENFVNMLNEDSHFSGVYIVGHSEGSLVGMVAAQKGSVKKFISVAGAGESADKILKVQLESQPPAVVRNAAVVMDSLKAGYQVKNVNPELNMLLRPGIQPYMMSWIKYNPQAEIKKLKIPVMIVQGGNDLQVSMAQADMLKKAAPAAKLVAFKDMTHTLKNAAHNTDANQATYKDGQIPLAAGFASAIISFIKK